MNIARAVSDRKPEYVNCIPSWNILCQYQTTATSSKYTASLAQDNQQTSTIQLASCDLIGFGYGLRLNKQAMVLDPTLVHYCVRPQNVGYFYKQIFQPWCRDLNPLQLLSKINAVD